MPMFLCALILFAVISSIAYRYYAYKKLRKIRELVDMLYVQTEMIKGMNELLFENDQAAVLYKERKFSIIFYDYIQVCFDNYANAVQIQKDSAEELLKICEEVEKLNDNNEIQYHLEMAKQVIEELYHTSKMWLWKNGYEVN